MRLKDIIKAQKSVTSWGQWKQERMPVGAFPLSWSPKRSLRLGAAYRWRLVTFETLGELCRLLIAYRTDIEEYRAILGIDVNGDTRVATELAFHGTHPGWHVHAHCTDLSTAPVGSLRWPDLKRYPRGRNYHRNTRLTRSGAPLNDTHALVIASEKFRLHASAGDLLSHRRKDRVT